MIHVGFLCGSPETRFRRIPQGCSHRLQNRTQQYCDGFLSLLVNFQVILPVSLGEIRERIPSGGLPFHRRDGAVPPEGQFLITSVHPLG